MSLWVDIKFANMLGSYLDQFRKLDNYLYNFRCPVCGDSRKNKSKSRGYIYKLKDQLNVKCHNCDYSSTLGSFIKLLNINLYNEYLLDELGDRSNPVEDNKLELFFNKPIIIKEQRLLGLQRIDTLPMTHPSLSYLIKRKIPREKWQYLFFTPKFKEYISSISDNYPDITNDYPRLIIPYYNSDNQCYAISARSFGKELPKYYNLKFDDSEELIYGMNTIDTNKRIYCMEGPIDSLFIPNSIATTGTAFNKPIFQSFKQNLVIVPDNEPRSPTLTKLINNIINMGYSISLFPESFKYKDINEAIQNGMTAKQIQAIIDTNVVVDAMALLKFNAWKKC